MKHESTFEHRGVVEGFSGAPWSMAHRKAMFEFGAARGMNTYLYALVVSCEEIHEEKRQYGYKSLPPTLARFRQ